MSKIHDATGSVAKVGLWAVGFTVAGTLAYSLFEHVTPFESLYWAIVSGSSTGYGDYSPATVGGRVVTIVYLVIMLWVVTPVLTARIAAYMIVNNDAWTDNEQETLKQDIADIKRKLGA
ncbi:cAMP-dependent Kef-type K+ transporter [Mycobacterium phage Phabba]|uniref:Membrane protein n=1 Tax=Mycobacterium phage Phabba TaxID=2027899 RepID=A0A249XST9_9CAUD|nr:cAMP-dependent Kef-type K+ transporter [Mycobacterium phage Phabba]ASZ74807.1 membrane protein [Mycobacterium phage Phabba]